ncbi:flagellar hook-basal body complex protein FliE [Xanthomonas sp. XNM01]|uniref:flagellar hook-basal body complex protein FliE n=1 Tax=Xanthomonas sp. XNM01 TaxID=2769289 RepID=UPI00177D4F0D|nr:flagellar hook-basal body complex protein FliE [Xanthomonas sp. XNM01]MBD9368303.1 flagellar hook-basal body complex protein FliE [Xanthomonas sp. XNM01]
MSHSIDSVLSQIRSYQTQLGQGARPVNDVVRGDAIDVRALQQGPAVSSVPSFSETLRGALEGVNGAQQRAGALAQAFERGEPGADLARVMIASQQSQVAFRATVEVRNRLVQAYQDVMNMPL